MVVSKVTLQDGPVSGVTIRPKSAAIHNTKVLVIRSSIISKQRLDCAEFGYYSDEGEDRMVRREVMQERLLDAAIDSLSSGANEQISVRQVTDAAGVNVAAVTTAFGGRSALLDALMLRVLAPVNAERTRRLDSLGASATIEDVVHAFVDPLLDINASSTPVAVSVLSAVVFDTGADLAPLERVLTDPGIARLSAEIHRRHVLSAGELSDRVRLAISTMLAAFAMSSPTRLSDAIALESLVQFISAGIRADSANHGRAHVSEVISRTR